MPKAKINNYITMTINGMKFKVGNIISEEKFIVENSKEVSFLDKYSNLGKHSAKNLKHTNNIKDFQGEGR